jgi:quinol monooxygenase YgiN
MLAAHTCCPIVELRQYTLHPGKRDVLIELFDREFIETQEAVGMKVIGQFRDLDDPNRFSWLRGFQDMTTRMDSLQRFYGGPIWKAHREAANATMIDSNNVLLLRPARPDSGFSLEKSDRPSRESQEISETIVVATIYYFASPVNAHFIDFFERLIGPTATESGASILAYFVTDSSKNTFPMLPVREGENVFIWFSRFANQAAHKRYLDTLNRSRKWRDEVSKELARQLKNAPEILRLSPTTRSQLR